MTNFQNRLGKHLNKLLDDKLLDEERIRVVSRPLFYSKYKFTINMYLDLSLVTWGDYVGLKDELINELKSNIPDFGTYQSNATLLGLHIYSNEPDVLPIVGTPNGFDITSIDIIDKASWNKVLPPPKPKKKFYHVYNYRIIFTNKFDTDELTAISAKFKGPNAFSHTYPNMFYVKHSVDLVLIKILFGEHILNIEDRSHCGT